MRKNKKFWKHFSLTIVFIILILFFSVGFIVIWDNIFSNKSPYNRDYNLDFYHYNRYKMHLYPLIDLNGKLKT